LLTEETAFLPRPTAARKSTFRTLPSVRTCSLMPAEVLPSSAARPGEDTSRKKERLQTEPEGVEFQSRRRWVRGKTCHNYYFLKGYVVDKERKHLTSSYCVLDREPWNTTENWRRAGSDWPLAFNLWPYQRYEREWHLQIPVQL